MENFIFCEVLHWSKDLSANIDAIIIIWEWDFYFHSI